jgi:hypothetical protein
MEDTAVGESSVMKSDIGSGGVAKDVLRALTAKCNDMK